MTKVAFKSYCPACAGNELCEWEHNDCGSYEKVDEYGNVYCNKCANIGKIWTLVYRCGNHSDFKECTQNGDKFKNALKMLLTEISSIPGGLKFSRNLLNSAIDSGYFDD